MSDATPFNVRFFFNSKQISIVNQLNCYLFAIGFRYYSSRWVDKCHADVGSILQGIVSSLVVC